MTTIVYPLLGSLYDFGFVRFSGVGLGNSFFNYFHAIRAAEESRASVIAPSWASIKPGTVLRRERSKRFYGDLFRAHATELAGLRRIVQLVKGRPRSVVSIVDPQKVGSLAPARLNLTKVARFEFGRLHDRRQWVRDRLLSITRKSVVPIWGEGGYIALHVRLGDFGVANRAELESGRRNNLRIPLEWYLAVVSRLRKRYPYLPVTVFSDGSDYELAPLLSTGAKLNRSSSDIDDLLSLASASILVGANSTFSQWAAFLGNMRSVWFSTSRGTEKPTGPDVPIAYLDFEGIGDLDLN